MRKIQSTSGIWENSPLSRMILFPHSITWDVSGAETEALNFRLNFFQIKWLDQCE